MWRARRSALRLLDGRCILALALGDFQRQALAGQQPTSATLKRGRKNRYYLDVQVKEDAPEPPSKMRILHATLGVDVGLRHIATDSAGHQFQGQDLADYRQHRANVRAWLQAKADTGSQVHTQGVSPGTQTAFGSGATPPETGQPRDQQAACCLCPRAWAGHRLRMPQGYSG